MTSQPIEIFWFRCKEIPKCNDCGECFKDGKFYKRCFRCKECRLTIVLTELSCKEYHLSPYCIPCHNKISENFLRSIGKIK